MKRVCLLVLTACGPTVAVADGDDGEGDGDEGTTSGASVSDTYSTSPTTSDPTFHTTPVPPDTGDVDSSDVDVDVDDGDYIMAPDGSCFTHCVECDVWAQDCPRGEKCQPWANDGGDTWNASRCSPLDETPGVAGDPCSVEGSGVSGIDTCDIASMCFAVDAETNEGTCVARCEGSEANPVCANGLACMMGFSGYMNLCLPVCDPLAPACAVDEVCAHTASHDPQGAPFVCQPVPPLMPQPYAAECRGLAICDAGLACVWAENVPSCAGDQRCCTLLGDSLAPPACPDIGQSCIPIDDTMMEGPCYCGIP